MDTTLNLKEQAYETILEQLHECTTENSACSAVVVMTDNKTNTVKVFGLNLMEEEVPSILIEAASFVHEQHKSLMKNRTLN
jgi:hypothetical protein